MRGIEEMSGAPSDSRSTKQLLRRTRSITLPHSRSMVLEAALKIRILSEKYVLVDAELYSPNECLTALHQCISPLAVHA